MRFVRQLVAAAAAALAACGVHADAGDQGTSAAEVVAWDATLPAALRDMHDVVGIAGNDMVHAETLSRIIRDEVRARDFAGLNEMETYFRKTHSRLPGGTWELDTFHRAIQRALAGSGADPAPCGLRGTDFTDQWARYDPSQPGAYIAEARLYLDYAWCVRGSGYANTVAPTAWQPFSENVDKAYEVLSAHAGAARPDPEYYALMERIYTAQGRDADAFQKLLDEASGAEPYYYAIYFNAAWHAMPQWGGSMAEVDRIARYATARTRGTDGSGAYVRVYWDLMSCGCEMRDFAIDPTRLSQAMDDVSSRTPSDWNAAHFAQIACRLGDANLTRREFARGGREDGIEWGDPGEWLRCRQFAGIE